jgi:hypothetical protein
LLPEAAQSQPEKPSPSSDVPTSSIQITFDQHPAEVLSLFEHSKQADAANPANDVDEGLFPLALEFEGQTSLQIDIPHTEYHASDTSIFRWAQICKWVAHLLSRTRSPQEVTAVTFNYKKNHNFEFSFTKNRQRPTAVDIEAAKALELVLKSGFSGASQAAFLERTVGYIVKFCPTSHQDRCREILDLGPVVARHMQAMIQHSHLHLEELSDDMVNEYDQQLLSLSKTLKKTPLEAMTLLVLRIIECAYDCVDELKATTLSELLPWAHMLCNSTFYHRMVRKIEGSMSVSVAQEF